MSVAAMVGPAGCSPGMAVLVGRAWMVRAAMAATVAMPGSCRCLVPAAPARPEEVLLRVRAAMVVPAVGVRCCWVMLVLVVAAGRLLRWTVSVALVVLAVKQCCWATVVPAVVAVTV